MAESYEIQQDGAIVFIRLEVKMTNILKVPVLAYPKKENGKLILLDDNNEYPVFSNSSNFSAPQVPTQNVNSPVVSNNSYNSQSVQQTNNQQNNNSNHNIGELSDLDELNDFTNSVTNHSQSNNTGFPSSNPAMIHRVSQMNNPQEFKKMKTEWLEKAIMDYTKNQDFNVISFMKYLSNDSQLKTFKPSENDVVWTAAF